MPDLSVFHMEQIDRLKRRLAEVSGERDAAQERVCALESTTLRLTASIGVEGCEHKRFVFALIPTLPDGPVS